MSVKNACLYLMNPFCYECKLEHKIMTENAFAMKMKGDIDL